MTVKIIVDSEEAMNRILGSHKDLEVQVRRSVILAIAKSYTNCYVDEAREAVERVGEAAMKTIQAAAAKAFGTRKIVRYADRYGDEEDVYEVELDDWVKSAIHLEAKKQVENILVNSVNRVVRELDVAGLVKRTVAETVNAVIAAEVKTILMSDVGELVHKAVNDAARLEARRKQSNHF